jgi:hypothetical protein
MKNFVVLDHEGNILRSGSCPEHLVELQGEIVLETDRTYDDTLFRYDAELGFVPRDPPEPPVPTEPQYVLDRREAYPTIEAQLDTLYHEGVEGWRSQIAAVKAQHPKI